MTHSTLSLFLTAVLLLSGCQKAAKVPQLSLVQPSSSKLASSPCEGIKIVGELTISDFKSLFHCLNEKNGLEPLKPVLIGNADHTAFFVQIYNDLFANNPTLRAETFEMLKSLEENGGLKEFLTLLSLFIEEFIKTDDFHPHFKALLQTLLKDDLHLTKLLKAIVLYPSVSELAHIAEISFSDQSASHLLFGLGAFLRHENNEGIRGSQTIVEVVKNISEIEPNPSPFGLEDLSQLSYHAVPRNLLEALFKLQRESKLSNLIDLLSDFTHRSTTTVLTGERLQKLERAEGLTEDQKKASYEVLRAHPVNDLSCLVKLISSLHRGFMEDENKSRQQNILASFDIFLQGVKGAFDSKKDQGPDADASKVVTTYSLFMNIAYLEVFDKKFHELSRDEKFKLYTNNEGPEQGLYAKYSHHFTTRKKIDFETRFRDYKNILKKERDPQDPNKPRWSPEEISEKLRIFKEKFNQQELPELQKKYGDFLNEQVRQAFRQITETPLFLDKTVYDFLLELKNVKSIALFLEKLLLNLDNELLDKFIKEFIQGQLGDFFEFNQPLMTFMKSLDVEHSGATWLSGTILRVIHGFADGMPMKDQITLIALVESVQIVERLLIHENRVEEIREVLLPLIKAVNAASQDERILRLFQWLHNGQFEQRNHETGQVITQLTPLLIQLAGSGFLEEAFHAIAHLGKHAETLNHFFHFLLLSEPKRTFLNLYRSMLQDEDHYILRTDIEHLLHIATTPKEIEELTLKIDMLRSNKKKELLKFASENDLLSPTAERPVTPLLKTISAAVNEYPKAVANFGLHLGNFLTPTRVHQFVSAYLKYREAKRSLPHMLQENILTYLIRRDEINTFFKIMEQMLAEETFQSTHLFIKEIIDRGELERMLHLLSKILLLQEIS